MLYKWDFKSQPETQALKREVLKQAISKVLLERYYGMKYEDKLSYHSQTADQIMRLLEKWQPTP